MEDSIKKLEIEKFQKGVREFVKIYRNYSERNVKCLGNNEDLEIQKQLNDKFGFESDTNYFQIELFTEIPKDILMGLYDILESFVQICETHDKKREFESEDKDFISAAKCIDNIIKHKKKDFNITDIIKPDFFPGYGKNARIKVNQDGTISIPLDDIEFRLGAKWVEIKQEIKNGMNNKKHFPNYEKYFMGRDVCDTVIIMSQVIQAHIRKE